MKIKASSIDKNEEKLSFINKTNFRNKIQIHIVSSLFISLFKDINTLLC